jgi:hypothetical protein
MLTRPSTLIAGEATKPTALIADQPLASALIASRGDQANRSSLTSRRCVRKLTPEPVRSVRLTDTVRRKGSDPGPDGSRT